MLNIRKIRLSKFSYCVYFKHTDIYMQKMQKLQHINNCKNCFKIRDEIYVHFFVNNNDNKF